MATDDTNSSSGRASQTESEDLVIARLISEAPRLREVQRDALRRLFLGSVAGAKPLPPAIRHARTP